MEIHSHGKIQKIIENHKIRIHHLENIWKKNKEERDKEKNDNFEVSIRRYSVLISTVKTKRRKVSNCLRIH